MNGKMKFGQLAVSMGLVSSAQVEECLQIQKTQAIGQPLGQIMVQRGYISSDAVSGILQRQAPQDLDDDDSSDMEIEEIDEIDDFDESSVEMMADDISDEMIVEDEDDEPVEDGIPLDLGYSDSMKLEVDKNESPDFDINSAQDIFVDDDSDAQDAVALSVTDNEESATPEQPFTAFDTGSGAAFDPNSGSDSGFDVGEASPFDTGASTPFDPTSGSDSGFDISEASPFDDGSGTPFDISSSEVEQSDPFAGGDQGSDPFGGSGTPFDLGDNSSPFDVGGQQASDPFAGGQQGSDPFSNDVQQGSDPFAGGEQGSDPFGGGDQGSDPFGGSGTPFDLGDSSSPFDAGGQQGSDPFGGGQQVSDPFAGGDQGSDPFGGGQQGSDPFGGGDQGSDPFGGGQQGSDPFGGGDQGSDPFGGGQQGSDPFGGGQQGSDPFGGSGTPFDLGDSGSPFDVSGGQQGSDPFGGGDQGSDPFGGQQGSDPFAGGDQGNDPFGGGQQGSDPFGGGDQGSDPFGGSGTPFDLGDSGSPFDVGGGDQGSDPFGGGQQGSDPFGGGQQGSDPFGGGQQGSDPFGGGQQGSDPFGGGQQGSDPFGGGQQGSDPFGGSGTPFDLGGGSDPFAGGQQGSDPFAGGQQGSDPFGGTNPNDIFSNQPATGGQDSFFNQFPDTGNNSGFDIFGQPNQGSQISPEEDATISEEQEGAIDLFSQSSIDKITTGEEITLSDNGGPGESGSFFSGTPNSQNLDSFFAGQGGDPFNPASDPTIDLSGGNNNMPMNNVIDLGNSQNIPSDTFGMQPIADPINLENSMNANDFDPLSASDPTISYENNNLLTGEPNAQTQEWDWESINNQNQQLPPDSDIESDFFNPPDLRSDIKPPQPQGGGFDLPDVVNTGDVTIAAPANPNPGMGAPPFQQNIGTFPPTDSPFAGGPPAAPQQNNFAAPKATPSSRRSQSHKKINIPRQRGSRISRRVSARSERSSLSSKEIKYLLAVLIFCIAILIIVTVVVLMKGGERRVGEIDNNTENTEVAEVSEDGQPVNDITKDPEIDESTLASYYKSAQESMEINSPPRTREAIKNLSYIISKRPDYEQAYFLRAKCFFRSNRYREAKLDAEKALESLSNPTECYYILAVCAQKDENYELCIDFCNKALDSDPGFLKIKSVKMKVMKAKGLLIDALKLAKELQNDGYRTAKADIHEARVAILERVRGQKQYELLDQAVNIDQGYAPFYYELGISNFRTQDDSSLQKAGQYIEKFLSMSKPDDSKLDYLVMKELHLFTKYKTGNGSKKVAIFKEVYKNIQGKRFIHLPCISLGIIADVQRVSLNRAIKKKESPRNIKKKEKALLNYIILAAKARSYMVNPRFRQYYPRILGLLDESFNTIASFFSEYQAKIKEFAANNRNMQRFQDYVRIVVKEAPRNNVLKLNDTILRFDEEYVHTSIEVNAARELAVRQNQYQKVHIRRGNKLIDIDIKKIAPGPQFTHELLKKR
ncbi:hypothetical protein [Candidatus Uabimicrobium amorphum]|nr:hypothetical protein [Candidatus Uabimicrobium amorphum]